MNECTTLTFQFEKKNTVKADGAGLSRRKHSLSLMCEGKSKIGNTNCRNLILVY